MITYSVDLEMDAALRDEYLVWLHEHVRAMLALPGFSDASLHVRREPAPAAGRWAVVVHYRLRDWQTWQNYLAGPAAAMRAAGVARFGTGVTAQRRVLEAL